MKIRVKNSIINEIDDTIDKLYDGSEILVEIIKGQSTLKFSVVSRKNKTLMDIGTVLAHESETIHIDNLVIRPTVEVEMD